MASKHAPSPRSQEKPRIVQPRHCTKGCPVHLKNQAEEEMHYKMIHDEHGKCPRCFQYFPTPISFMNHWDIVHCNLSSPYPCPCCEQTFNDSKSRMDHFERETGGMFMERDAEYILRGTKSQVDSSASQPRTFKTLGELCARKDHLISTSLHRCPDCPLVFTTTEKREAHFEAVHQGLYKRRPRYICTDAKCFSHSTRQAVIIDRMRHYIDKHGPQRFSCMRCPQRFVRFDNRKSHLENIHHLPHQQGKTGPSSASSTRDFSSGQASFDDQQSVDSALHTGSSSQSFDMRTSWASLSLAPDSSALPGAQSNTMPLCSSEFPSGGVDPHFIQPQDALPWHGMGAQFPSNPFMTQLGPQYLVQQPRQVAAIPPQTIDSEIKAVLVEFEHAARRRTYWQQPTYINGSRESREQLRVEIRYEVFVHLLNQFSISSQAGDSSVALPQ